MSRNKTSFALLFNRDCIEGEGTDPKSSSTEKVGEISQTVVPRTQEVDLSCSGPDCTVQVHQSQSQ